MRFFDGCSGALARCLGSRPAGVIDALPLSGGGSHQPVQIEGQPVVPMAEQPEVDVRLISPGYVHAMHISLLRGRDFDDSDAAGRPERC